MATERERVSGSTANTLLIVGGVIGVAFIAYEVFMKPTTTTTVIKTTPSTTSSAATTAAEITAGASAVTTIANDLFGSSDDGS
jgi:hypothetical protein